MSISETGICNLALSRIGISPINTIVDPQSQPEKECYFWYHQSRKYVLRQHTWNFAIKCIQLEFDTDAQAFRLPADYIRMASKNYYQIKGNHLYSHNYNHFKNHCCPDDEIINLPINCCDPMCSIDYIYDCNKTNLFDSLFIEALSIHLAYEISYSLTKDLNLKNNLRNEFLLTIPQAKSIDSQDSNKLRVISGGGRMSRLNRGYYW